MYDAELAEISGLDLEQGLPGELEAAFLARAKRANVPKGRTIITQGSDGSDVYLIVAGSVKFSVFSPNGRETVLREMGPGRLFGEMAVLGDQRRSASAIVVADAVIGHLSGPAFNAYLKEVPGAGHWLARQLAARVRNLTEKYSEIATLSVCARIHMEIMREAAKAGSNTDQLQIARFPTHAELAARIGTHREAVTRELKQLEDEGFISRARGSLTIHSLSRMRTLMARMAR